MKVSIKLNDLGAVVTPYEGNPSYGYIVLNSVENVFANGWMQAKERSAIIRGKTEMLQGAFSPGQKLPGKIAVTECTEDNIPAQFSGQFDKSKTLEENIAPYIKRAGKDGVILLSDDKRILRFTEYDASGTQADVRVQHTNVAEIKASNASVSSDEADLPG